EKAEAREKRSSSYRGQRSFRCATLREHRFLDRPLSVGRWASGVCEPEGGHTRRPYSRRMAIARIYLKRRGTREWKWLKCATRRAALAHSTSECLPVDVQSDNRADRFCPSRLHRT